MRKYEWKIGLHTLTHPTGRSTLPALAHVSSDEDSPTASTSGTHPSLFDPSSFFRPGADDDEVCGRTASRWICVFVCLHVDVSVRGVYVQMMTKCVGEQAAGGGQCMLCVFVRCDHSSCYMLSNCIMLHSQSLAHQCHFTSAFLKDHECINISKQAQHMVREHL